MSSIKKESSKCVADSSRMETLCADIFNVTNSREEIFLCFGTVRSLDVTKNELSAVLSSRIILSPYTAKRISIMLNNKIAEYEAVHGSLSSETLPQIVNDQVSLLYDAAPGADDNADQAILLMQLVEGLKTDYAYERSYKLSRRTILQNRFLFGISKTAIQGDPEETLVSICQQLNMPAHFQDQFRELLDLAKFVHFGFEENNTGCMYKVYLEFDVDLKFGPIGTQALAAPFLLHLGFKWSARDNSICALSRYTCYPFLSPASILERIGNIYCAKQHEKAMQFATSILNAAVKLMPEHKFLYIEVCEDNNPRVSFDIKLYEAKLLMQEIRPLMNDILDFYEIPLERFNLINDRYKDKTFGHLSGGIDRAGHDFLTVYFGVEWR